MNSAQSNRFQDFFVDVKYISFKNYLYNYLLRKRAIGKTVRYNTKEMILEVGSGISPTVTAGSHVVYSDLSFVALQTLKQNFGNGMFIVADGMELPFKSDSFSYVISSEVLEHLADDRKALTEIARVIKSAGALVITFPHRKFYFTYDDRFVNHLRRYELIEMVNRLKDAGLSPVSIRKVLGPLEKVTMCIAVYCFSVIQGFSAKEGEKVQSPRYSVIFSFLFKWINRLYAGLIWLDAAIMPQSLSSVLLIKAVKK